ncbi:mannose-1-phosphate guanylyltransferase [Quadrisphaera sp. DSM 44207]|uniref:mannose-1-phosphate guanylyltransferase n=1 Tax=Quadrisphaera sp. DSM 44207 TaxID=1881057 RepID=UPI00210141D1|nr:mannose-1-phosphate guanylyltransferase [Quadrisphaera sp. DSM 44207]
MTSALPGFAAVVPAGGAGTRLWPLSRASSPKFLHDLTGTGRTLLQATWDRLAPLAGPERVLVVTGAAHAGAVREQLPGLAASALLAEPSPRDSMAAIGLAAAVLARREGEDVVVGSFAADHVVAPADLPAFAEAVRQAVVAAEAGWVVTIGIEPTSPATGFGYVRTGEPLGLDGAPLAHRAADFVEKPDAATAAAYLAGGRHRWNAGMFVARAGVLLGHLARQLPALHDGLRAIAAAWDGPQRAAVLDATWPRLTRIAVDHAVAEPVAAAGGVAVVPGAFGWDDVGDWDSLASLLPGGPGGAAVLGDPALVRATAVGDGGDGRAGVVVPASGRAVSVVGVPGAVVVDTPDALLVTTREHAQLVKGEVEAWRAAGRTDLL